MYIIIFVVKQEGNADPALKPDFYIFLVIFQHKWMFLSTMQTLPFKGHDVVYQCKGFYQSNIVCKYEVNLSTNEKVMKRKWQKKFYDTNNLAVCFGIIICVNYILDKIEH